MLVEYAINWRQHHPYALVIRVVISNGPAEKELQDMTRQMAAGRYPKLTRNDVTQCPGV